MKTPAFYEHATDRLNNVLDAAYHYAERHFEGNNRYLEAIEKNVDYARTLAATGDILQLRRLAPEVQPLTPATSNAAPEKPESE